MAFRSTYLRVLIGAGLVVTLTGALAGCSGSSSGDNLKAQCSNLESSMQSATDTLSSTVSTLTTALSTGDGTALGKLETTMKGVLDTYNTSSDKVTDTKLKPAVDKLGKDLGSFYTLLQKMTTAAKAHDASSLESLAGQMEVLAGSMSSDGKKVDSICGAK